MRFSQSAGWTPRLVRVLEVVRNGGGPEALRLVVAGLRPTPDSDATAHVEALCTALETGDPAVPKALGALLRDRVGTARVLPALTRSGIPGGEGFVVEAMGRIGRRLLPPVPDPDDLRDRIRALFDRRGDHRWVAAVPDTTWCRLLTVLGIDAASYPRVGPELAAALRALTHHAAGLALSPEVAERLPHLQEPGSPFLALGSCVLRYLESFDNEIEGDEAPLLSEALEVVDRCRSEVRLLREENHLHGTSLHLTSVSFRLLTLLDRLHLLLHLTPSAEQEFRLSTARLLKDLVRAEQRRDHLLPHLRASADLLAQEVVEHAARKGSKYITTSRPDYLRFLRASMGGGLLVALFALGKVVMGSWEVPLGVEALLYGINYSLCFVLIYLTGAALATKQPAMTAATLARSLGEKGHELGGLEDLVVRVWRSQFVSFLGNLAVALPVAALLSFLVTAGTGEAVADPDKARAMLDALHPLRSGSVPFAAVAGVLLFAAGLLSGWVDNWIVHRRIQERAAQHPVLVRLLGADGADRAAAAVDRTLGALVGNVFLGFGLGSMGTLGEILGLPLDIRHIAFASAQFGTSLHLLGDTVATSTVVWTAVGVAAIGLVNFLVSFGLSLALALESRGVTFGETRLLLLHLLARLRRHPLDWFFPPREGPRG